MQIRSKVGTSVKTVQGFLQFYWFNAPRAPALVHSCTCGFCRCSVLIACRNTVGQEPKSHPQWQLQQLPGHLQVALDLPTRLSCCSSLQIAENFPAQPCAHITFPGLLLPASSFPNQPISACGRCQSFQDAQARSQRAEMKLVGSLRTGPSRAAPDPLRPPGTHEEQSSKLEAPHHRLFTQTRAQAPLWPDLIIVPAAVG